MDQERELRIVEARCADAAKRREHAEAEALEAEQHAAAARVRRERTVYAEAEAAQANVAALAEMRRRSATAVAAKEALEAETRRSEAEAALAAAEARHAAAEAAAVSAERDEEVMKLRTAEEAAAAETAAAAHRLLEAEAHLHAALAAAELAQREREAADVAAERHAALAALTAQHTQLSAALAERRENKHAQREAIVQMESRLRSTASKIDETSHLIFQLDAINATEQARLTLTLPLPNPNPDPNPHPHPHPNAINITEQARLEALREQLQAAAAQNKRQLATTLRGVQLLRGPSGPDPKLLAMSQLHVLGEVLSSARH